MPNHSRNTLVDQESQQRYFGRHLATQTSPLIRKKTKGRYIGASVRESISKVFDALGSWEGMVAWAKDNPDAFYGQVVPKLLPTELAESGIRGNLTIIVQRSPSDKHLEIPVVDVSSLITTSKHEDDNE